MPLLFWRIWKWVIRLITRRCELQRICSRENGLPDRTQAIGRYKLHNYSIFYTLYNYTLIAISLSHSKNKVN